MEDFAKKDCYFYRDKTDKKEQCKCLTERICNKKQCHFYLTSEQYAEKMKQFSY